MKKENDPPVVDPELEALLAHPKFPAFKKLVNAAIEKEAAPSPEPETDGDLFDFFDGLFKGNKDADQ